MNTYFIDGGVGKQVAFSAIIDALAKKDKDKIQIHTPYVDVFGGNPNVKLAFDAGSIYLHDQRIKDSDKIFHCEPYKSEYLKGEKHLIEMYCKLFGVKYQKDMRPKMYTKHYKQMCEQSLLQIWNQPNPPENKNFIVVQFTGGQPPMGYEQNTYFGGGDPSRNYPRYLAQKVIDMIHDKYGDELKILNYGLPNEPIFNNSVRPSTMPFSQWHEMLKMPECKGVIGIDSCMQHFAASAGRKSVVLWGGTRWTQLGYPMHKNINNVFGDKWDDWDESKWDGEDPRNIMIEPERVFEQFEKIYGKDLIT